MSAHNLIFGDPYLDIGEQASVQKLRDTDGEPSAELKFVITFTRRGWFSDSDDFKCAGELQVSGEPDPDFRLEGKWNHSLVFKNSSEKSEKVW